MGEEIMPRSSLSNGSEMEKWNIGMHYEYPPHIPQRDKESMPWSNGLATLQLATCT